jgi:hypothetical protein
MVGIKWFWVVASEVVGSSPIAHPRNDKGFSVDSLEPFFVIQYSEIRFQKNLHYQ